MLLFSGERNHLPAPGFEGGAFKERDYRASPAYLTFSPNRQGNETQARFALGKDYMTLIALFAADGTGGFWQSQLIFIYFRLICLSVCFTPASSRARCNGEHAEACANTPVFSSAS